MNPLQYPPSRHVRVVTPASRKRIMSPAMLERTRTPNFARPRHLRTQVMHPAVEMSPIWPERWGKEKNDKAMAESAVEMLVKDQESAMMELLESEAEREAEREIMLRSVQDPEQRIELERRFTADRSAATKQVLELASRQDRLLRHRSLELGVEDAHPNRTASPTFSARDVPSSPNILTLIDEREGMPMVTPLDSRPRPASVTVSSAETETLLLSAAKAGSRSLPVMGYYPSKVLKSPFLSPAAPGRPKKRIEPFSQSSTPTSSTLVSPESSFTALSRSPDENARCMSPLEEAPQQQRSRSQLGGERERDREWERGGGIVPMRRAKTALDGRISNVPAAHARANQQDSPSNRSSPPMNQRSYSLYQGMMHALKETSVPRTPMSRSPRSLDQRSSSSLDGSIVSEMSMPSVSSSMYSSAAPRCSTPQHLRNQHWATATRDAIKVGGKAILDKKEMSLSLPREDEYMNSMIAAKRFLLQRVVELPTGTPQGALGVQRPVTAALYGGLKDRADELLRLRPRAATPKMSVAATYGRGVKDRKGSEKSKLAQLKIERLRSDVAERMDRVIFGRLAAEEEREKNKIDLAASVCIFARIDATSPTALFPGLVELLLAIFEQADGGAVQEGAAMALSSLCVQPSVREQLLERAGDSAATQIDIGGGRGGSEEYDDEFEGDGEGGEDGQDGKQGKGGGGGGFFSALIRGLESDHDGAVMQCASLAAQLCKDGGGVELCREQGVADVIEKVQKGDRGRGDKLVCLFAGSLLELFPFYEGDEYLSFQEIEEQGLAERRGVSFTTELHTLDDDQAGGGMSKSKPSPAVASMQSPFTASFSTWSPGKQQKKASQVFEVPEERKNWRPSKDKLPRWERSIGLPPADLRVSAKTLPARHKE